MSIDRTRYLKCPRCPVVLPIRDGFYMEDYSRISEHSNTFHKEHNKVIRDVWIDASMPEIELTSEPSDDPTLAKRGYCLARIFSMTKLSQSSLNELAYDNPFKGRVFPRVFPTIRKLP